MSQAPRPTGSLRPAPNWMDYVSKLQSIVDQQASLLDDLRSVTPADADSASQLSSVLTRMEGFISGLQLSLALSPHVPTPAVPSSTSDTPDPKRPRPTPAPKPTPTKPPRQPSLPSYKAKLLETKQQAISKLQHLHPVPYDPSRQLIYEPMDATYRIQPISDVKFLRDIESCISDDLQLSSPVELVRRLPRGSFRIQFSPEAFPQVQSSEPHLELRHFSTWQIWHDPNPANGKSIVLNPVPLDITASDLVRELAYANTSVHHMEPTEVKSQIKQVNRLQFRNRATKELQASRSVRVFCDDQLAAKILTAEGVFLGPRAIHARPYTPPRSRCYKCNALGSHKADYCRCQRTSPKPAAPAVASSSKAPPPPDTATPNSPLGAQTQVSLESSFGLPFSPFCPLNKRVLFPIVCESFFFQNPALGPHHITSERDNVRDNTSCKQNYYYYYYYY